MPSTQESIDKWKRYLHREGKLTIYKYCHYAQQTRFYAPSLKCTILFVLLLCTDTLKKLYLCAKHFDTKDIQDTQMYLYIDGVYKS